MVFPNICLGYSNLPSPGVWAWRDRNGRASSVKIPVRLRANNGDFLQRAAIAGEGLIMQPTFYLYEAIRDGRLVPVLTDYGWPELSAYAVYPATRHLSSRVRAFVDFLVEHFAGEPAWDQVIAQATEKGRKRTRTRA